MFFSVDATMTEGIGKFVNDSPSPNAKMKVIYVEENKPRLLLFAITTILPNTEIRYDYQAKGLWWRKKLPKYKRPLFLDVSHTFFILNMF